MLAATLALLVVQSPSMSSASLSVESPMFRGGPAHSGFVATVGPTRSPGVAWTFETGGTVRSTPALVAGVLYVGSSDGSLYALDAADGTLRWSFDAGRPISSSPAVADGLVVFADRDNTIWALDRTSGEVVWRRTTGRDVPLAWGHEGWDYITSSPVVTPGSDGSLLVVVGSGDGAVYALNGTTGEVVWRHLTERRIRATPAVARGLVLVGGGDGLFQALDLENGQPRWRFRTTGMEYRSSEFGYDRTQISGSAAVAGETVYVGSRDGSLYALDLTTGDLRWHVEDGSAWVINSPAVGPDILINGRSSSTNIRSLDPATGAERWVFQAGALVFSSPVVASGVVYQGTGGGEVLALDGATGEVRWRFRTGGAVYASPVVSNGRLYIGSDDGRVYALENGPSPTPFRAVFYDESFTGRAMWGGDEAHRRATDYFERYGYRRLDGPDLVSFFRDRVADRVASVVVFGMDALPEAVTEGSPDATLFRRYLEAGGKVVWLHSPPLIWTRDSTGQVTGVDRERAMAFTGVDVAGWDFDQYASHPTATGRRWGLERWSVENPQAHPDAVDVVLSRTEDGRATGWVKGFGGAPGSGLVMLPATLEDQRLDEIRRVAEFGIMNDAGAGSR